MALTPSNPPVLGGRCARRDLLRLAARASVAGASLGAMGCARLGRAQHPAAPPVVLGIANSFGGIPPATASALAQGFARANPGFAVAFGPAGGAEPWRLAGLTATGGAPSIDLTPALRAVNFNAGLLLPGAVAPGLFARGGALTRLPFEIQPIGVAYRPDALAAAGVPPPAPDWTFADFRQACAAVAGAIRSGRLAHSGVTHVLPLMTDAARGQGGPQMASLSLWGAFLLGFGGGLVQGGRPIVATPASMQGLTALLDLVRTFANVPGAPPPGLFAPPPSCAFQFSYLRFTHPPRSGGTSAVPAYARFPALPVRAVQPADLGPLGLVPGPPPPTGMPVNPPPAVLEAAARFFLYLYSATPQSLLGDIGRAPVSADPAVQRAFWSQYGMAVDPADIVFPDWNWGPYLRHAEIAPVLAAGLADPGSLPAGLAAFAAQLTLGPRSGASGAGASQAAPARGFPTAGAPEIITPTGR
jgi:ABC-type glycerol-3-phosphate transport system substrate-binding protein